MKRSGYLVLVMGAGSGFASVEASVSDGAVSLRCSRPPPRWDRQLTSEPSAHPDCAGGGDFATRVTDIEAQVAPIGSGFNADVPHATRHALERRGAQWNDHR